jgi:hypothetical protein
LPEKLKHCMIIGAIPPQADRVAIWGRRTARRVTVSAQLFRTLRQTALCAIAALFLSIGFGTASRAQQPPAVGTVVIAETQISFMVSGQAGGGTLNFGGNAYPFKIGGLGVGGFGISTIKATGNVYQLTDVSQFYGTYFNARVGWAIGLASGGQMWLENPNGVVMHLKAEREGLILSLGADAIVISRP